MKSKLSLKGVAYDKKDDDYETPKYVLEMLLPFIEKYNVVYDPFYCNGKVKQYWKELNKTCINDDLNAFEKSHQTRKTEIMKKQSNIQTPKQLEMRIRLRKKLEQKKNKKK